jgi:hypothetical protein
VGAAAAAAAADASAAPALPYVIATLFLSGCLCGCVCTACIAAVLFRRMRAAAILAPQAVQAAPRSASPPRGSAPAAASVIAPLQAQQSGALPATPHSARPQRAAWASSSGSSAFGAAGGSCDAVTLVDAPPAPPAMGVPRPALSTRFIKTAFTVGAVSRSAASPGASPPPPRLHLHAPHASATVHLHAPRASAAGGAPAVVVVQLSESARSASAPASTRSRFGGSR